MNGLTAKLRERWQGERAGRLWIDFRDALTLADKAYEALEKLKRDEHLTPIGRRAEGRRLALKLRDELVRISVRANEAFARAERDLAAFGTPPAPSQESAAAAVRQEIRSFLRGLDPAERVAFLSRQPEALEAAAEAPAWLSGLDAETLSDLLRRRAAAANPRELARLEAAVEEANLVAVAAETGWQALARLADLGPVEARTFREGGELPERAA